MVLAAKRKADQTRAWRAIRSAEVQLADYTRLRQEEQAFEDQMHGVVESAARDHRSRHGSYYDLVECEDWSLGNQLLHGARLTPHSA